MNTLEEFKVQFEMNPSQLYKKLTAIVRRHRVERDTALSQLVQANQSNDILEGQTTELKVDLNISRAENTSAAAPSTIDAKKGT